MNERLTDQLEIMYRHIRSTQLDEGIPQSSAFAPLPKDQSRLSVDRSSMTTPREAHKLFTDNGFECARIYGISVGEFLEQSIVCFADPLPATATQRANPAHAIADFSPHSRNQQKIIAKRLKRIALARGCLFVAP
jgi:hypothetical protein